MRNITVDRSGRRARIGAVILSVAICVGAGCALSACSAAATATSATSPHPTASAVLPATGSVSGGEIVTIQGTGLAHAGSVTIGGQVAPLESAVHDSAVTVSVPASADFQPGPVSVVLDSPGGAPLATIPDAFTYTLVTPADHELAYVMTHWSSYNTAQYGDLSQSPLARTDAANFVSQAIAARGVPMNGTWFDTHAGSTWTPQWGEPRALDAYMAAQPSVFGVREAPLSDRASVRIGDVVALDGRGGTVDDVLVVVGVARADGRVAIALAGHDPDSDDLDLDRDVLAQHPTMLGHFWEFVTPNP